MAELTKRQSEALAVIKAAGPKGISFKDLQKKLGANANSRRGPAASTMRQRLGFLVKEGVVKSTRNGRFATYSAA